MCKRKSLPLALLRFTPERAHADRLGRYENKVVKFMLSRCGRQCDAPRIEELTEQAIGERRLTFDAFEQLHDFPLILRTHVFDYVGKILTMATLLNGKFVRSPVVEEYSCLRDRWPDDDRPLALVFHFPGLRVKGAEGNLALHNLFPIDEEEWANVCICRARQGPGELLVLEPFSTFLDRAFECVRGMRAWME